MPSLPFVVAPKRETRIVSAEVNGETCSLEFPVFGSLLAGEEVDIRESDYQAAVYRESSHLADALVSEGTEETEAQRLAIRCLSTRLGIPVPLEAAEQRILLRHADLVARIQSSLADAFAQQVRRTVTAAIAHRLPGCRSWSVDDTDTLPQPLQQAIAAFIDSERNAKQKQKTPDELIDGMVETLGKLGPDGSQDPPTGQPSTGDAESSGPVIETSAEIASPVSPSPTSPKRSRKVNAAS
jgi:hypothetical protein